MAASKLTAWRRRQEQKPISTTSAAAAAQQEFIENVLGRPSAYNPNFSNAWNLQNGPQPWASMQNVNGPWSWPGAASADLPQAETQQPASPSVSRPLGGLVARLAAGWAAIRARFSGSPAPTSPVDDKQGRGA